jgi:hypothetical protein
MDVHQRCLETLGASNYQTLKRSVDLFSCERKIILNSIKAWFKEVWAPFNLKIYSSKTSLSNMQNLEHKYKATKTQFLRKIDWAQFSINKIFIPPKEIGSWVWCFIKGPWIDSHDLGPIMSPYTYITVLSKLAKRNMKEEKWSFVQVK